MKQIFQFRLISIFCLIALNTIGLTSLSYASDIKDDVLKNITSSSDFLKITPSINTTKINHFSFTKETLDYLSNTQQTLSNCSYQLRKDFHSDTSANIANLSSNLSDYFKNHYLDKEGEKQFLSFNNYKNTVSSFNDFIKDRTNFFSENGKYNKYVLASDDGLLFSDIILNVNNINEFKNYLDQVFTGESPVRDTYLNYLGLTEGGLNVDNSVLEALSNPIIYPLLNQKINSTVKKYSSVLLELKKFKDSSPEKFMFASNYLYSYGHTAIEEQYKDDPDLHSLFEFIPELQKFEKDAKEIGKSVDSITSSSENLETKLNNYVKILENYKNELSNPEIIEQLKALLKKTNKFQYLDAEKSKEILKELSFISEDIREKKSETISKINSISLDLPFVSQQTDGSFKITNLSNGSISKTSKDAINGSQIFDILENATALNVKNWQDKLGVTTNTLAINTINQSLPTYAKNDASTLTDGDVLAWRTKLGIKEPTITPITEPSKSDLNIKGFKVTVQSSDKRVIVNHKELYNEHSRSRRALSENGLEPAPKTPNGVIYDLSLSKLTPDALLLDNEDQKKAFRDALGISSTTSPSGAGATSTSESDKANLMADNLESNHVKAWQDKLGVTSNTTDIATLKNEHLKKDGSNLEGQDLTNFKEKVGVTALETNKANLMADNLESNHVKAWQDKLGVTSNTTDIATLKNERLKKDGSNLEGQDLTNFKEKVGVSALETNKANRRADNLDKEDIKAWQAALGVNTGSVSQDDINNSINTAINQQVLPELNKKANFDASNIDRAAWRNALGINKLENRANAGIASALAVTGITIVPNKTTTIGVGLGAYRGQTAIAIGAKTTFNSNNKIGTLSVSYDSQKSFGLSTGLSFGF